MSASNRSDSSTLLERNGPTYGISFTREQADLLIDEILQKKIVTFESIDTGYNNLIFFLEVTDSSERYALKIGGRYWNKIKTEAEVQALDLLEKYTTIPVPKVLAYSSDRTNPFGVEWILMTRLPGVNMRTFIQSQPLSAAAKTCLIRDLAEYVSQMHSKMPRFDQIGALTANGEIGTDLNRLGPWSNYEQFIRDRIRSERTILNEDAIFAPIKDFMLNAIEQFERLRLPNFDNLPLVFSHGDLDWQNILISTDDLDAPRITGIVDWEWSGSFPCSEEYFTSFDYFLNDSDEIRQVLFDEFEKRGIRTPRTIQHFPLLEKLNRFATNLALWHLTDLNNPDPILVNEKLEKSRSNVRSALCTLQDQLGQTITND